MKKNNEIIVYKENIFNKIKNFFKSFFRKKVIKNAEIKPEISDKNINFNNIDISNLSMELNKKHENLPVNERTQIKLEIEVPSLEKVEDTTEELKEEHEIKIEMQNRKEEVFRIYSNVKSGKCKLEDLAMYDLINVMILLNEEKKLYN